jgi:anti-anti-sigma regulatory factor
MIFSTSSFSHAGQKGTNCSIKGLKKITATEAIALRAFISKIAPGDFEKIYLDVTGVEEADLSGINEIIHAHYSLQKMNLPLVLVYRRGSVIEKWIATTGMNAYLQTALLPAA